MLLETLPLADWEALSLTDRARLMAAAVRNGYTDIRSIKEAYANFLNLKLSTGNMYSKGGDTDDTYEPEVVNPLDNLPEWKALENIDYVAIPDPEFTREKTGAGSIEYFSAEEPEGITYTNGYHRDHPMPGKDVILYNPNDNDELDVRLDALHIMPKDSVYDTLNLLYREAAKDGDIAWAANQRYKEDVAKYGNESLRAAGMTPLQYFENEADGLLRNMFIEGSPEYIESKKYYPYKQKLRDWNSHLMPYIDNIQQYLETGEKPKWLLPEVTVTNQNAYGGNLFDKGGKKKSNAVPWSYIESELRKRGVTNPVHLSALRANMEVESGRNPGAVNPYSGAKGLLQWLGARKPKSWSLDDQLDYIAKTYNKFGGNEWLSKSAWKRFNETNDPAEAARLFRRYWERPEASSWYDTDKYFGKSRKGSFLPDDTNDVLWQAQNLQYREPRRVIFTKEDQKLLDTPMQTLFTPKYEDEQTSLIAQGPSLSDMIKLDESLYERSPMENWALFNSMLEGTQLTSDDPYGWFTSMMSLSPKATPLQKLAANMYQLFAPNSDGDYLYHGLNFAAYGGKVNKFDGKGGSSKINNGKIITLSELPLGFKDKYADMPVTDPYGKSVRLYDAARDYGGTHVYVNDVPHLTDYLLQQDLVNGIKRNDINASDELTETFTYDGDNVVYKPAKEPWHNDAILLDEIVKTGYKPIVLDTYYPVVSDYPWTGHSTLSIPLYNYNIGYPYEIYADRRMDDEGYNILKWNCADGTKDILNYSFNKNEKPLFFTTPGDILDFAINELGGVHLKGNRGRDRVLIPVTEENVDSVAKRALKFVQNYYKDRLVEDDFTYASYYPDGNPPYGNLNKLLENYSSIVNDLKSPAASTLSASELAKAYELLIGNINFEAFGGPLILEANKFNDGGFFGLPEHKAWYRAMNLKTPYTNYEQAVDMNDSAMLRIKKFFDEGVSNCTLTVSQLFNPKRPIGRANTIVTDPIKNGFYEVDENHIVPGTMVIASHPNIDDDNPNLKYHTMIVTGFAPNDYEYTFRDGTKYQIKKGEPLVNYSRGKASSDNYVYAVPLSVYNDKSEGKTFNRYYRPIDLNYPEVMLDNVEITPRKH